MSENSAQDQQGGVVIQFPVGGKTPPPLPSLPRAIPTPGYGGSSSMFGAALTVRFDRKAA